jgi:nucleoside-triphosphatase
MIYILTGPIRTGKTSSLMAWAGNRKDVAGMLCPDDANGQRYFYEIENQEQFQLEVNQQTNAETLSVGPFQFLVSAFDRANQNLLGLINQETYTYVIIDELGKLELKHTGLHSSAARLIPVYEKRSSQHLILVVRDSLLNAIIEHYQMSQYELITSNTLSDHLD